MEKPPTAAAGCVCFEQGGWTRPARSKASRVLSAAIKCRLPNKPKPTTRRGSDRHTAAPVGGWWVVALFCFPFCSFLVRSSLPKCSNGCSTTLVDQGVGHEGVGVRGRIGDALFTMQAGFGRAGGFGGHRAIVDAEGARLGVSCPRCATARRQAAEVAVPVEW